MSQRGGKKEREGVVTSNRMKKTIVVSIERRVMHPKYKKFLKRLIKVKAHDEKDECQVGDRVLIVECRPISREKHWRVRRTLVRAIATDKGGSAASPPSPALQVFRDEVG